MLNHLGLETNTHRVFLAVASRQASTVDVLARSLDLTEGEVRRALDQLSALALAELDSGGEASVPVDAELGLKALLAQKRAELAERQSQVEQAHLAVEQWLAVNRAASAAAHDLTVTTLHGADAVRNKLTELAESCRDEVWSFNPGGMQSHEQLERARPLNKATLARGVTMRAVYLDSARNDRLTGEHLRDLVDWGAEVRTVPVLPVRMIVIDREMALVPFDERNTSLGALLVQSRGLVAGLVSLFLTTWRIARPLGTRACRAPDGLSVQERNAMLLWAQGCTDAAVARRLGVSHRTVRRMSESVSSMVSARSRFELGARAMALGWITQEDLL
jgi:DNA-binding CsgD family transcriptional regulator